MFKKLSILFLLTFLLFSCSKNNKELVVYEPSDEEKAISLYAEAVEALKKGDAFYAGKKFKDVEDLMPQTDWAAKASLMSSYSEYSRNSYSNAILV